MRDTRQDDELDLSADVGPCRGCGEWRVLCAHAWCRPCHRGPTRRGCLGLSTDRPLHLCCGWWGSAHVLPWTCLTCHKVRTRRSHA